MGFETEQEVFWSGEFGADYINRNNGKNLLAWNCVLFSDVLRRTRNVTSVIEFGSNIGLNLRAIANLLPDATLSAIEINSDAVQELKAWGGASEIYHQSILDFMPEKVWDMVLIKGVLIHINPDYLNRVYEKLYTSSGRYICLAEYYNPTPVAINYRGHEDRLFKRDFAGELLDKYSDLNLVDYGFMYHRDPNFPQGDFTWFLLEKEKDNQA